MGCLQIFLFTSKRRDFFTISVAGFCTSSPSTTALQSWPWNPVPAPCAHFTQAVLPALRSWHQSLSSMDVLHGIGHTCSPMVFHKKESHAFHSFFHLIEAHNDFLNAITFTGHLIDLFSSYENCKCLVTVRVFDCHLTGADSTLIQVLSTVLRWLPDKVWEGNEATQPWHQLQSIDFSMYTDCSAFKKDFPPNIYWASNMCSITNWTSMKAHEGSIIIIILTLQFRKQSIEWVSCPRSLSRKG